MFDKFMGLPMHPLLVHAVVVMVPLLVLSSLAYLLLPRARVRLAWAAAFCAVTAPIAGFVSMKSGEALEQRLIRKGYPPEGLRRISEHAGYGELTFWFTLGLALVTVLLIILTSRRAHLPTWVVPALGVVIAALGVAACVYVFLAGDTGARMLWENV